MHRFKRFYLLGSFVVSLVIPELSIIEYVEPIVQNFEVTNAFIPIEAEVIPQPIEVTPVLTLETILWTIYMLGAALFAIRFAINLFRLYRQIVKNDKQRNHSFIYVLLKTYRIPHSFFKFIFVNQYQFENNQIPEEVRLHEETHAKQWHSLDILLLELLQIIFWFHPLVYILKHHVKLNHEFLADDAVLQKGVATKNYQNILLQFSSNTHNNQLASAINYSSFKKRFTVMKTQTSKTKIWLSTLLVLPILAILFYSFAEREYVEKDQDLLDSIQQKLDKANKLNVVYIDGATKAMMKEYNDWIIKFNTTHYIDYSKYQRIVAIYDMMTEEQRASVEKYPVIPDTNLSKVKPKSPTVSQFEEWKNTEKYALWIDGVHVPNSVLNNYVASDIFHFVGSKVYDNARSEKFPQPFQFSLYTKDGFRKNYQKSAVNNYNAITKKYSNAISTYLKGDQKDNSELKILKAQADKIYNLFTKEELKEHNILPPPPVPAENKDWQKVEDILEQQKATKEQVAEYNAWAKKMNSAIKKAEANKSYEYPIIKQKEVEHYLNIYKNLMTNEQRKNAEAWPNIPPPPPPPPSVPEPPKTKNREENIPPPPPPIPENASPKEKRKMQKTIDDYERKYKRKVHTASNITTGETFSVIANDDVYNDVSKQEQETRIQPIEIYIDSDNNIQFNGKKVEVDDINKEVKKLNQHLSTEDHRKYVSASIITEKTEALDYAKSIQIKLREVNVWSCSISSNEGLKKAGLDSKHFSLYSGLTVKEAEEKQKKIFNESQNVDKKIDSINNSGGPWKVSTVVTSYEFIDDDGNSSGKVNLEPAVLNKKNEPPVIYLNEKEPIKGHIALTKEELKKLKLTLSEGNVTNFKLKIPGIKTDFIQGNTISATSIKNLENFDDGMITIFDIKDEKENRLPPIIIQLKK
ncbi:M56 family metallopeptidase [Winogradskyella sp. HB-48]|uniref:M56 family metallopeptidase n=1 Tax=Winogradskyella sp. HB-48 TaxID=3416808 RepID=UPI003CF00680